MEVRLSNMVAAKGIKTFHSECIKLIASYSHQRCCSDIVRPSWNGQDGPAIHTLTMRRVINDVHLQIQTSKGEVIITNDGATILKSIQALHPAAKMVSIVFLRFLDVIHHVQI